MSYAIIQERIDNHKIIILDGGIGGELQKIGAKMDKGLWCGRSSIDNPNELIKVHENYINAGVDVITANTYASTPISMRKYGYEDIILECNQKSVQIAKKAAENSKVSVAGSVSTYGSFHKLGIKNLIPSFDEHIKILVDAGVDLIILEAMSSQEDIIEAVLECSNKINLPTWLSISCVFDENNKVMLGYNDNMSAPEPNIYGDFELVTKKFSTLHKGPMLVAHSEMNVTNEGVKILNKNLNNIIGAYPNRGHYVKPEWKFTDKIEPKDYLNKVNEYIKSGALIVGGCCGIGVEEIKAISILKK